MAHVFVRKPGTPMPPPEMEPAISRLQSLIFEIEALGDVSRCRVCCKEGLTKEHIPAKSAGNRKSLYSFQIDHAASQTAGTVQWASALIQANIRTALCGSCNNHSGAWYNSAYLRLVWAASRVSKPENAGETCEIKVALQPLRALKQALTHLLVACQPGITSKYPSLRTFLTEKTKSGSISPLRLFLFLSALQKVGRASGLAAVIELDKKRVRLLGEFVFWPLGWLVTLDDSVPDGTIEVTGWSQFEYGEKKELTLSVPCRSITSPYPETFGS